VPEIKSIYQLFDKTTAMKQFENFKNIFAFFSSLFFGCVGRLCLLGVAIPDTNNSLFSAYVIGYQNSHYN
jgi:hypothetical protein